MKALSECQLEQVDASEKISQCLSVKDEEEISLISTAGKGCSHVMKRLFRRIVKISEDSTKITHQKLSEEFGALLPEISFKVAGGDKADYEEAYLPIIQSGEHMNVRISAECDEKPVFLATNAKHSGVIFSSVGVRYQTFCANMSRTFLVNPTESQKRCYTALEASLAAGVAACVAGTTLGQVFDAIVAVLSQTKDDAGNSLDTTMFKIVGFGIGYELREAPLLVQKDACFTLKQGCTIALYIGLENLVSKDVIKGLSTCSMQIGDTVVVGAAAPTVVTRDAMDTKLSSVVLAFNDEESEDDAKVKESKKPKREAVESASAVSDRRAKVGRGTEDNTKHKVKIEQDQLIIQKNRIAERTGNIKGDGKKTHKTKALEASEAFVSYKSSDAVPRSADANKIHADLDNSTVIFPVLGTSVVVHASNIKGAIKDKTANVVRAQFNLPTNIPGTTAFIKELSYRFPDATSATASLKKITDVKRKFTTQLQEKKDLESLTEQAAVRILRGSVRPHALRGIRYWPTIGRKVKQKGDLELHENGLKFICQATRTEFEFVFSNVQYAFFQKAGRNYKEVLLHFRLKHDIMVAQKKTKDVQFFLEYMADDDILVGPGQKRRAAGDGDEIEEEQRQSALREKIERAFLEFAKKIDAVLPTGADGKKIFEFQVAFEEMQFVGSPKNQAVDIVPTADCLVHLHTRESLFLLELKDIEAVIFERMSASTGLNQKTFDMVILFKAIFDDPDVPIGKCFHMISACNAQNVFTIKEYLNSCSIVWYDSPAPVSWTEVIKVCRQDPEGFWSENGWGAAWGDEPEGSEEGSVASDSDQSFGSSDISSSEDDDSDSEISDEINTDDASSYGDDSEVDSEASMDSEELEQWAEEEDKKTKWKDDEPAKGKGAAAKGKAGPSAASRFQKK